MTFRMNSLKGAATALFVLSAALTTAQAALVDPGPFCVVCKAPLPAGVVWVHDQGYLCNHCAQLEKKCCVCRLPLLEEAQKTSDGRFLCALDASRMIVTTDAARRVFEETRNRLDRLSHGALQLQQPQVSVQMFDVDYWNHRDGRSLPLVQRRTGFSSSKRTGDSWTHSILLHSVQGRLDLMAVCAHEWTHLWINERLAPGRMLDDDTVEAICELTAYKLMQAEKADRQIEQIETNLYTRGRIKDLIQLDKWYGWKAVLDWVRTGSGTGLDAAALTSFGRPQGQTPPAESAAPATELPERLSLRAVAGSGARRTAVINDSVFSVGEEKPVPLQDKTVTVRCLEILDAAVVLQIDDDPDRVRLTFGGP